MNRKGEKIGWTFGWLGGFIWIGLLSVVWLFQDRILNGMIAMVLFAAAVAAILVSAPWRHPHTKYWKLMLPMYLMLFASVALYVNLSGGLKIIGMSWTSFFWAIPCLIPLFTLGNRTWNQMASKKD